MAYENIYIKYIKNPFVKYLLEEIKNVPVGLKHTGNNSIKLERLPSKNVDDRTNGEDRDYRIKGEILYKYSSGKQDDAEEYVSSIIEIIKGIVINNKESIVSGIYNWDGGKIIETDIKITDVAKGIFIFKCYREDVNIGVDLLNLETDDFIVLE